jgi:hypothetical protein
MTSSSPLILGTAYRCPYLFTVLAQGHRLLELRRHRLLEAVDFFVRMRWIIQREAAAYGVSEIITEPKKVTEGAVRSLDLPFHLLTFDKARRTLSDLMGLDSNARFFERLVAEHAELQRFVRILPVTGKIARTETWKTDMLVAATLALAASRATRT